MPNRIIKESVWTSESLSKVSIGAQGFFLRLLPLPDDHGCFDARPAVVLGLLFPLQLERVKEFHIEEWLDELQEVDSLRLWNDSKGVQYGHITSWNEHNDLLTRHAPQTPCPPWLLDEKGNDCRLATETLQAYERIRVAIEKLSSKMSSKQSSSGEKPTYREIIAESQCSNSTLVKYYKYLENNKRDITLHAATNATHKNPNPNPNLLKTKTGSYSPFSSSINTSKDTKRLSDLWNELCPNLPKCLEISTKRKEKMKVRLDERHIDKWKEIFEIINKTPFLLGKNKRKWKATFDWIMANQENSMKVLEGQYDSIYGEEENESSLNSTGMPVTPPKKERNMLDVIREGQRKCDEERAKERAEKVARGEDPDAEPDWEKLAAEVRERKARAAVPEEESVGGESSGPEEESPF